jgi:hypothetical protein
MPRADADGVIRTEPIETHVDRNGGSYGQPLVATDDWSDWEAWMAGHKNLLKDELIECTGKALGIVGRELDGTIAAQAKRITASELKLAEAVGAIDVLRGKGAPGSFNVLRQEMLDSVGDALGVVRADFEDKLATQVKKINELELKLAEAVGALNVLRGKGVPGTFNVKGTFSSDVIYSYLDVVAFNGSSWVTTRDSPGGLPGPGWQLLSSAGKRASVASAVRGASGRAWVERGGGSGVCILAPRCGALHCGALHCNAGDVRRKPGAATRIAFAVRAISR